MKGFEGWYFKHQKENRMLALIPGRSRDGAFVQVVTQAGTYKADFPIAAYRKGGILKVGDSSFSPAGVELNLHTPELELTGRITYGPCTPLASDIMGPFRFFPMACRHRVVSMSHGLFGQVHINGALWDFDGGKGYIEGDSGHSFPTQYAWVQCNDFSGTDSVTLSIARIPFGGLRFMGCIAALWLDGREYRLATYHGAVIRSLQKDRLELEQGSLRLLVEPESTHGHTLAAPQRGAMSRIVREAPCVTARFRFWSGKTLLFDAVSAMASFEYVQ